MAELVRSGDGGAGALVTRSRVGQAADQVHREISAVLAGLHTAPPTERSPSTAAILVRSARLHRSLLARLSDIDSTLYKSLSQIAREFKRTPRFADGVAFACDRLNEVTAGPVLFSTVSGSEWRVVAAAGTPDPIPDQVFALDPGSIEYHATDQGRAVFATGSPRPFVRDLLGSSSYIVTPVSTHTATVGLIHCVVDESLPGTADAYLSLLASVVGAAWAGDDYETALHAITNRVHDEFCSSSGFSAPDKPEVRKSVQLTRREAEVLTLVLRGRSNPDIADTLFLSVETVKSHIKNLLRKHGAANRSELIMLAASALGENQPPRRAVRRRLDTAQSPRLR
jgi:DNA-binding CsgD family transcriptional regulator